MPELPEVETVLLSLRPVLCGAVIKEAEILFPPVVARPSAAEFGRAVRAKKITRLDRRGKYLVWELDGGLALVTHLGMTGRLLHAPAATPPGRHTRLVYHLEGRRQLLFDDQRKFGRVWLLPRQSLAELPGFCSLGPEPLSEGFSAGCLAPALKKRKAAVKAVLLDQKTVAGLGNIYADEALFLAGIAPWRPANCLNPGEVERLAGAIVRVLREGIEHRGTTIRDYADAGGNAGTHQHFLRVYGREGKNCPNCGAVIARKKIAGRSSYFCPGCQRG